MKTKKLGFATLASTAALLCVNVMAVEPEPTRTVVIEGDIFPEMNLQQDDFVTQGIEGLTFTAIITETPGTATQPFNGIANFRFYEDAVQQVRFTVNDAMGEVVFDQTVIANEENCPMTSAGVAVFTFADIEMQGGSDSAEWSVVDCNGGNFEQRFRIGFDERMILTDGEQESDVSPMLMLGLFESIEGYPTLLTGEVGVPVRFTAEQGYEVLSSEQSTTSEVEIVEYRNGYYEGFATSIEYGDPDSDGDGISDLVDTCPASIVGGNVEFGGWLDSGVSNKVDDLGCTIMDHYQVCQVEEEPVRGIRSVRRGPSNCEKAVSYDLVADGVISYAEARMLRNALYESYSSDGRR